MRIAQISDLHFTRLTLNPLRLFSKRILGLFNWIFSRNKAFSEEILEGLPPLLKKLDVDLVLLGGDFTTTALEKEFQIARNFIKKISAPKIAIPGNHDVYTYRSHLQKHFYRFFKNHLAPRNIQSPLDFFTLLEHQIEAHPLPEKTWIVAIDVCRATNLYSSRGLFSKRLEERMKEVLTLIPEDHSILVLCHYPFFQNEAHRRTLKRGDRLEEILKKDSRIKIFFHGHTHRRIMADLQPSGLPLVLDSGSCAQTKRASWNLIDLTPSGCKITPYRWDLQWKPSQTETISWTR